MLFVGVIFGSPAFGWFSDHIGRRCLPMILGAILSLIVILMLMYTPNLSLFSLIILFFLIGFFTSSQVLSYPAIAELNPSVLTGTAVSAASVTIMLSGVIFQPLFGWLLERNWDKTLVDNVPVYSVQDFNSAMWIMPIAFVIGLVVAFLIRETYCELQNNVARIYLLMDSFGIGATADAVKYGDADADTLRHIAEYCAAGKADKSGVRKALHIPNLVRLGLNGAAAISAGHPIASLAAMFLSLVRMVVQKKKFWQRYSQRSLGNCRCAALFDWVISRRNIRVFRKNY